MYIAHVFLTMFVFIDNFNKLSARFVVGIKKTIA